MRFLRKLKSPLQNDKGGVAVEFALLVPVIFFAALGMVDMSLASMNRMQMDRTIRAGVEMVERNMITTDALAGAINEMYTLTVEDPGTYQTQVATICRCSDGTVAACGTTCGGGSVAPSRFVQVSSQHLHDGYFLPSISVRSDVEIQMR